MYLIPKEEIIMAMIGGIADPDYDFDSIVPEKTPEELAVIKEREERLLEECRKAREYLANNPMKVDLEKQDVLFIWFYGRYYLLNKRINTFSPHGGLILKHSIMYGSWLVFDDKGIIYKAREHVNTFIQDIVNNSGSKKLLQQVIDLTDEDTSVAYEIMLQHQQSVESYVKRKESLNTFIKSI